MAAFLAEGGFPPNHAAGDFGLGHPIVPALEYFLSLEEASGFDRKWKDIRRKPVGSPTTNDRTVAWASLCAELGGIYIVGRHLGLTIQGFDRASPRAKRSGSDCDIAATGPIGETLFYEVKRNSAEEKQDCPDLLIERLSTLGLPYAVSCTLIDRNYRCEDLDEQIERLRRHVAHFESHPENLDQSVPWSFDAGAFLVTFHDKDEVSGGCQYFEPVFPEEFSEHLLERGRVGRDGRQMVPMVDQAVSKGADYLMCRVPGWEPWGEAVPVCFETVTRVQGNRFRVIDRRIPAELRGIVLFADYDDYCLVEPGG